VLGKKAGTTTLYVLGANDKTLVQRMVVVAPDMLAVRNVIAARFPNLNVQVSTGQGSLLLTGEVPNSADADAVVQAVTPFLGDKDMLINRMTIDRPLQVQLRVRITEVDRNVTQQLGINWQAMGNAVGNFYGGIFSGRPIYNLNQPITAANGSTSYPVNLATNNAFSFFGAFKTGNVDIQTLIDALNQEGLLTVLAEPNLVALSGQTASFLAGGEFPIPVPQSSSGNSTTITVQYKEFGVRLSFVPTILATDRISLKVSPEVSQLTPQGAVVFNGFSIPALTTRRAATTIELASGQTFAIAGLLQNDLNNNVAKVPGLGDIPVLGELFKSTAYQRNETELVVLVTPVVVKPFSDKTATASAVNPNPDAPSDINRLFLGPRIEGQPRRDPTQPGGAPVGAPTQLRGSAGFMLE